MNLYFINLSRSRRPEIYGLAERLFRKYAVTILQPLDKRKRSDDFHPGENVYVKYVPSFLFYVSLIRCYSTHHSRRDERIIKLYSAQ